jgi:hypothetical protein
LVEVGLGGNPAADPGLGTVEPGRGTVEPGRATAGRGVADVFEGWEG